MAEILMQLRQRLHRQRGDWKALCTSKISTGLHGWKSKNSYRTQMMARVGNLAAMQIVKLLYVQLVDT